MTDGKKRFLRRAGPRASLTLSQGAEAVERMDKASHEQPEMEDTFQVYKEWPFISSFSVPDA